MPITLAEYAQLDYYQLGRNPIGTQVRGDATEFWLKGLNPGTRVPTVRTITVASNASADAEEVSVTADVAVKLYQGDVLKFGSLPVVVVAETTTVGTSATDLPVFPLISGLTSTTTAKTYALLPLLSLSEGGTPETTGEDAGSRNKGESLYRIKEVVGRDYTITVNGRLINNDAAMFQLENFGLGRLNIYWESRYNPFISFTDDTGATVTEGSGPGAYSGNAYVANFSFPQNANDLVQFNSSLNGVGAPTRYVILPNT